MYPAFQDDSAPCYRARSKIIDFLCTNSRFIRSHNCNFSFSVTDYCIKQWIRNLSHGRTTGFRLRTFELSWEKKFEPKSHSTSTIQELKNIIENVWYSINSDYIEIYTHQCQTGYWDVVKAKDGSIKYWFVIQILLFI